MINLDTILDGPCLKQVLLVCTLVIPAVYGFTCRTQVKAAKEQVKEKKEEIKRLQALVDNYTQQLIDKRSK